MPSLHVSTSVTFGGHNPESAFYCSAIPYEAWRGCGIARSRSSCDDYSTFSHSKWRVSTTTLRSANNNPIAESPQTAGQPVQRQLQHQPVNATLGTAAAKTQQLRTPYSHLQTSTATTPTSMDKPPPDLAPLTATAASSFIAPGGELELVRW